MAKKVVIGGQNVDVLTVEIGKTSYTVPLAGSMKRKDLLALKDENSVFQMFARYIPEDVLDNLTVDEYNQLAQAWSDANEEKSGSSLGES